MQDLKNVRARWKGQCQRSFKTVKKYVLVEGGGILNESLIKNDCVHKVYAYIAPKLFGGEKAKTPVEGKGIERIQEALVFDELKATPLGNDILLEGKVRSCLPES